MARCLRRLIPPCGSCWSESTSISRRCRKFFTRSRPLVAIIITMNTDNTDWLPFLLQTGDPLFPTGAYAHSLGLEEMVRLGVVRDEATLLDFFRGQIIPALARFELPHLRFAREAAIAGDLPGLC